MDHSCALNNPFPIVNVRLTSLTPFGTELGGRTLKEVHMENVNVVMDLEVSSSAVLHRQSCMVE